MQITATGYNGVAFKTGYQNQSVNGLQDGRSNAAPSNQQAKPADGEQQQDVQKLKDRDREVRAHEQAHLSAAGGIAVSGAHFQFVTGPDGQRYATGGDVSIDTSPVANDPEATMRKAETIRRAALAPAQPSSQDFSVAGKAAQMANEAKIEQFRNNQSGSEQQRDGLQLDIIA